MEKPNTVDEFLASIPAEGDNAFEEDTETDNSEDSQSEENQEEEESPSQKGEEASEEEENSEDDSEDSKESEETNTSDEKNIPFHKHPRWQKMHSENQELKTMVDDLKGEISSLKVEPKEQKDAPMPNWFVNLFGEDDQAWSAWQEQTRQQKEEISKEILQAMESKQQSQTQEQQKWEKWVDDQVLAVQEENDTTFDSKTRDKLLKIALDVKPTDDKGNIDFSKAYEIMQEREEIERLRQGKQKEQKKKVAGKTVSTSKDVSKQTFKTPNDFRNKDWADAL